MASLQPISFKAVLLGDSGVGKSSIFLRFTEGAFRNDVDPTMGAAFGHQTVETKGTKVRFNIWDTAGQERFRAVTKMYYKGANVAILVYDITNRASFENLKSWHSEVSESCAQSLRFVVVGNKEDLVEQEAVSTEEARTWAQAIVALYRKTSAKRCAGIDSLFGDLAEVLIQTQESSHMSIIHLEVGKSGKPKDACKC